MKIRTAIFGVYTAASGVGFVLLMAIILGDVRFRYVESMRRTLGDTAAFLAVFAAQSPAEGEAWARKLAELPPNADLLRVFASDRDGRVIFDSAHGRDVGKIYDWPMRGGGRAASENYSVPNVALVDDELRVRAPVRREGDLIGWVGVGRPLATVREGVSRARGRLFAYSCVIAVGMMAAGWWIAAKLTHSLERLTRYAQTIRDGGQAQPPVSRAKEIAALAQAFEEMRRALDGKAYIERYTQALTHEIKAPLSAIRGAAELLGEEMPREERARFLSNLRSETARIQGIIDRLLELSSIEARHGRLELERLDLRQTVDEVVASATGAAAAKKITLAFRSDGASGFVVQGEKYLLVQALTNLVQNAIEFTPVSCSVTVSLEAEGGQIRVVVEDTGPGLPDFALARLFERFYSLPRPDTGRKSTGLGLSIVREVARLHGGDVMLANRAEGGARATLTLPRAG